MVNISEISVLIFNHCMILGIDTYSKKAKAQTWTSNLVPKDAFMCVWHIWHMLEWELNLLYLISNNLPQPFLHHTVVNCYTTETYMYKVWNLGFESGMYSDILSNNISFCDVKKGWWSGMIIV